MPSPTSPDSTRRLVVLGAVCMAALALPLAFSGGAVATPAIGHDLGGTPPRSPGSPMPSCSASAAC